MPWGSLGRLVRPLGSLGGHLGSTVRPSMIFRSILAPFWNYFCSQNRSKIDPKINAIFDAILEACWLPFWNQNGLFLEVIFNSCLDSAENGAPHENTVNSNEIEARALGKATKKLQQLKKKQYENKDDNQTHLLMHFELILGGR